MGRTKPCGQLGCIAAYRIAWTMDDWTILQAAAAIGRGKSSLIHVAANHGFPARARSKPPKRFSAKVLREAWADQTRSLHEIARDLNTSAKTLSDRARRQYGLPSREKRRKQVQPCRWFSEMWVYGVSSRSVARHIGCDMSTVRLMAERLGLQARPQKGLHCRKPSVADFMRDELPRILLTREAKIAALTRALRASEHGLPVPATIIKRANEILGERKAA